MVTRTLLGNISGEATTPPGNIFSEAMRTADALRQTEKRNTNVGTTDVCDLWQLRDAHAIDKYIRSERWSPILEVAQGMSGEGCRSGTQEGDCHTQ